MKKIFLNYLFLGAIQLVLVTISFQLKSQNLSNFPNQKNFGFGVPACPDPINLIQPDGLALTLYLKGDRSIPWAVTSDDYTLLANSDGNYEYAIHNANNDLVLSGILAHNVGSRPATETNFLMTISPKIWYSSTQISDKKAGYFKQVNGTTGTDKTIPGLNIGAFPSKGVKKNLVILVQFSNVSFTVATPNTNFTNLFNQAGYNGGKGSVKDYFLENSYQQLSVTSDVYGPYTLSKTAAYYGGNLGTSKDIFAREAVAEACSLAEAAGVDFSQYDNDKDGLVDGLTVIHAGTGEETTSAVNDIWSHSSSFGPYVYDNVVLNAYTLNPELRSTGNINTIGVFCHEFSHMMGICDFYDIDYATGGTAYATDMWDIMCSGSYNGTPSGSRPAHHNAFSKYYYGWTKPFVINTAGSYKLPNAESNAISYLYTTPTINEYFMLENRQQRLSDTDLPGFGMLIYHFQQDSLKKKWFTGVNLTPATQYANLEEADAIETPASRAADPWPGTGAKTTFTDATTPNSKSWAGANTGKPITAITSAGSPAVISFNFMGGTTTLAPVANFYQSDTLIKTTQTVSFYDCSSNVPTSWAWTFPGGTPGTSTVQNPVITYNTAGVYSATLVATNASGNNTLTKNLLVHVTASLLPVANFSANLTSINVSDSVQFTDLSTNAPTSWSWEFEGGTPATSTQQNPKVFYYTGGIFKVKLTVSNDPNGSASKTLQQYIKVGAKSAWLERNSSFIHYGRGISDVKIVDPNNAWAWAYDGYYGTNVIEYTKTTNGGNTWTPGIINNVPATITDFAIGCMSPLSATTCWASLYYTGATATEHGGIWKTTNSGTTWTRQGSGTTFNKTTSFPNTVYFWDANNGWTMGDPYLSGGNYYFEMYTTTNGGTTWTAVPVGVGLQATATGIYGTVNDFEVVGNTIWFGSTDGWIYKSLDKGLTWSKINSGMPYVDKIVMKDANNGVAWCAERTAAPVSAFQVKRTTNGGTTWTTYSYSAEMQLGDIDVVGGTTDTWVTTDADYTSQFTQGSSFTLNNITATPTVFSRIDYGLQYTSVSFLNDTIGFAGAFNDNPNFGGIYKWKGKPTATATASPSLICSGSSSQLRVVTNGGDSYSWASIPAGFTSTLINPIVSPTVTTTYIVTVTSAFNTNTSSVVVTVLPPTPAQPSAIVGLNNPCAGSSQTYSVTNVAGTNYAWTLPAGWLITSGAGSNSIIVTVGTGAGNIQVTPSSICGTGTPQTLAVTISSTVTPSVSISSSANPICAGSSVTFTATPINGGSTPAYQWQVNGVNAGTNSNTFTTTTLTNGQIVTCILTSNLTCVSPLTATSTGITMTVNPIVVPSVSVALTTGTNPMCTGSSATFTATPTNGGVTPAYQWQINGVNTGTNSTTFTTTSLTTGQIVTCILTSNAICATPLPATSTGITMTVNPIVVPSVSIALTTGTNPTCAGSSVTFTATPTNGGVTPTYQWQVNGVNAGTNSTTFTTTSLTTGQIVTCILTSNANCATPLSATSTGITMTINPVVVPSVSIALTAGTNPTCAGSSMTFTATPTNGGTTPTYQWKVNGVNSGLNSTTFTTTTLTTGQIVTCVLTSNANCATPLFATSTGITVTVNPIVVPSVSIALTTGTNPTCAGSSLTFTASPTNGGATPVYQWQVNGVNAGTNSPTFTTTTLTTGQIVTCVLNSNANCATPLSATSTGITVTVNPIVVPSVAIALTTGTNPLCSGASATFTATPTNGGATPGYQWQVNGVNAGTNSPTFTTTTLTNGQIVTCILTSNANCVSPVSATSPGITMTVNAALVPAISIAITAGSNPTCAGASITFTATPTNGGATPSYQWKVNGGNVGANSPTYTTTTLTNGQIVTCVMTSSSSCASPLTAASAGINIVVNATLVPTVSIALTTGTNPMCAGSSTTFTATPTNGGTTPSYQWQVNGVNAGGNSTTFNSSALTNGQIVTCIMTSNSSCAIPLTGTSSGITMIVNPIVIPSVSIALTSGTNPSCTGTSLTFSATPTNGGTSPSYQWQVNGVNNGTNSPTYTSSTLATGQIVTCILTSNANCATPISATSNGVTMSINPILVPSVAIAVTSGTNPSCSGTSLTFTATPTNGGASPTYQWQVNGVNDGTNSPTYTSSTLATGQIVTCILTSNANCATPISATSNGVTMSINSILVPSVSIALTSGTNPSCSGTSLTFTATSTNGGTTPIYQWQVNGVNDGTNSPTYTSSTLTTGQIVTCILTSNANCATPISATSTGDTMSINPMLVPSVSIALTSGTNPSCSGTSLTFTATPTNGGTTPIFQWQVNGVNDGTNSPTYTSSTLATGQIVTCILTSNANCVSPISANSTGITMSINPLLVPSVSIALTTGTNPTCSGSSLTFTATPTNEGTIPVYQWQVDGLTDGTNSSTFTTSALTNGQIVSCILTSNANCVSSNTATSAGITMNVSPILPVSINIVANFNPACAGSLVTFTATPTNGGTTPAYQWTVNGVNTGANAPSYSDAALANNDVIACILTSNIACSSGNPANSNSITLTVNPIPTTPVITQNFDTLFSSVAFGNQWFMGLPGNPIAGAINQSYVTTSNNDYFVIVTDANGCVSDTSNVFNVFNTNIENPANFSFNIYPNPNNGNFSIQLNNLLDGAADFELFDAIGQLVYKKKLINKNNHEFYLRGVSSGIYTIKITTSENSLTRKLIIQK